MANRLRGGTREDSRAARRNLPHASHNPPPVTATERVDASSDIVRLRLRMTVDPHDDLAFGRPYPRVECRSGARNTAINYAQWPASARALIALDDRPGLVGRSVVDDDRLVHGAILYPNRLEHRFDTLGLISARDDHRHPLESVGCCENSPGPLLFHRLDRWIRRLFHRHELRVATVDCQLMTDG